MATTVRGGRRRGLTALPRRLIARRALAPAPQATKDVTLPVPADFAVPAVFAAATPAENAAALTAGAKRVERGRAQWREDRERAEGAFSAFTGVLETRAKAGRRHQRGERRCVARHSARFRSSRRGGK
jgi:hypothetical protein